MGSPALPPFSLAQVLSRWQSAPAVTAVAILLAVLYLWGTARVRRRHPARPWPARRTAAFLAGLLVIVAATESGIGTYEETLFWDHMVQHLMLLMIAPPLLVAGQPVTLLLHASRNPLHTWVKRVIRSRPVSAVTWPGFAVAAYAAAIVGTHLTGFMNAVLAGGAAQDAEHALFVTVGYLYFLPLIGREPLRWKVSYPLRMFLLFLAMPVDPFTGVVLGSAGSNPFPALKPSPWGPTPLSDVHDGGAVMWVGGAAIMLVLILTTFFSWTRETRPSGGLGWLESARRTAFAAAVTPATAPGPAASGTGSIDEDVTHLDAYNAYLARLNDTPDPGQSRRRLSAP